MARNAKNTQQSANDAAEGRLWTDMSAADFNAKPRTVQGALFVTDETDGDGFGTIGLFDLVGE